MLVRVCAFLREAVARRSVKASVELVAYLSPSRVPIYRARAHHVLSQTEMPGLERPVVSDLPEAALLGLPQVVMLDVPTEAISGFPWAVSLVVVLSLVRRPWPVF
jgi:hypothetical protein